ncbi:Phage tail protein [compost metagenome]
MRCNSPFAYSPVYEKEFDLSTNPTTGTMIQLTNSGDYDISPIIEIDKVGDGDISIVNTSKGGESITFDDLTNGEYVKVDCEVEEIETDIPGRDIYGLSNDEFISFSRGVNHIKVFGKCRLKFKYEFKFN